MITTLVIVIIYAITMNQFPISLISISFLYCYIFRSYVNIRRIYIYLIFAYDYGTREN